MAKRLSFKDFLTVDYTPGEPEQVSWNAKKRHRGVVGEETETTDEALDFQARQAKSRAMKKNKSKIAMGRRRAAKKAPTKDRIEKRAKRAAIKQIFNKLAKGKPKSEVPYAMRQSIEKRIAKMQGKIGRIQKKLLPDIRQKAKDRQGSKAK
jgi:GTP-dependent phosphoenolpyruvate carboxykinase